MRTLLHTSLALALAPLLVVGPASAQQSTTRGFSVGVHAQGASLVVENGEQNTGGGGGVRVGYGLNRTVTLYAQADGIKVDVQGTDDLAGSWTMGHLDLGARFHFANSLRRWVPYLEAAVTARAVEVTDAQVNDEPAGKVTFSGGAFSAGGGLSVYLKQSLALDVELLWTSGEFTQIDVGAISVGGLDIDAKSTRFNLGVVWWP